MTTKRFTWLAISLGVTVTLYTASFLSLPREVFWANDEGGKFLQTAGWRLGAEPAYRVPYRGRAIDPDFRYYPPGPLYPRPAPGEQVTLSWQPWFSLLSAMPYRWFGVTGLYIIPLLGSFMTVVLCGAMARRTEPGAEIPAIIVAGWASPLVFYGQLFWEHAPATCLGVGGAWLLWAAVHGPRPRRALSASVAAPMLLAAVALRHDMVTFVIATVIAAVVTRPGVPPDERHHATPAGRRRPLILAGLAVLATTLVVSALFALLPVNVRIPFYGHHVSRAAARAMDVTTWMSLPDYIGGILINAAHRRGPVIPFPLLAAGLAGLALCLLARLWRRPGRLYVWMAGAALCAVPSLYALVAGGRFSCVHGLLLPAPWIAVALFPLPPGRDDTRLDAFLGWLAGLYVGIHIIVATLTTRPHGGAEWGSRFLLTAYPLLAVVAAVRFHVATAALQAGLRRVASAAMACALLLIGCQFTVRGIGELQRAKHFAAGLAHQFADCAAPVITDLQWLPAFMAPTFARHEIYTVGQPTELAACLSVVAAHSDRVAVASLYEIRPERLAELRIPLVLDRRSVAHGVRFCTYRALPRGRASDEDIPAHR